MSQPDWSGQDGEVPVIETTVGWSRLYADPDVIMYGRKSIALGQVEWVSYSAVNITEKRGCSPCSPSRSVTPTPP
jgi:hypothetical protein